MNIETTVVQWLNTGLEPQGVHASMSVPSDRPKRFVTVERTGGGDEPHRSLSTLAIQVWAEDRYEASEAALNLVQPRLESLTELDPIAQVDILSVVHLPDPGPPEAERYQINIQITAARQ